MLVLSGGGSMIMINGNWEQIKDFSDVLRIVSENLGEELSKKISEEFERLELEIKDLNEEIIDLDFDFDTMESDLNRLQRKVGELKDYIDNNNNGTEFMAGMLAAYEMI